MVEKSPFDEEDELHYRSPEEEKKATAIVPDDKLSLAIGKAGQNVRLAAKLTDWKIDVKPYSEVSGIVGDVFEG